MPDIRESCRRHAVGVFNLPSRVSCRHGNRWAGFQFHLLLTGGGSAAGRRVHSFGGAAGGEGSILAGRSRDSGAACRQQQLVPAGVHRGTAAATAAGVGSPERGQLWRRQPAAAGRGGHRAAGGASRAAGPKACHRVLSRCRLSQHDSTTVRTRQLFGRSAGVVQNTKYTLSWRWRMQHN